MTRAIKLTAVVLVWIIAAALSSYKKPALTFNLADAVKAKALTSSFTGAGGHSGNCMKVNMQNLKDEEVRIVIPAGTLFKPADDGAQNILVPQEQFVILKPGESKTTFIKGFCCEASDRSPAKDMSFTLTASKDPKMAKLFTFLKGKQYPDDVLQNAIWCVSDNHQVSDIYVPKMEMVKPLRDELCTITGQKDTWYSTPTSHNVDAQGNISHQTTSVTGMIKFKALKNATIHNEIYDASGKLLMKNPNSFNIKPGSVEYDFEIRVSGWEKGTYVVKVFEDETVIHKQEFKL